MTDQPASGRTLSLMAALIAAATVVASAATLGFEGVAWYEAAVPCLIAGAVFVLQTRWALAKVGANPMSAVAVMMASIGVHFGVIVVGGLGLVLGADFDPAAVFLSLLAAFIVCQPLSTVAIRRTILAADAPGERGGATTTSPIRTPYAEASA